MVQKRQFENAEVFQLLSERKLSYGMHQNNASEAKKTAITKI